MFAPQPVGIVVNSNVANVVDTRSFQVKRIKDGDIPIQVFLVSHCGIERPKEEEVRPWARQGAPLLAVGSKPYDGHAQQSIKVSFAKSVEIHSSLLHVLSCSYEPPPSTRYRPSTARYPSGMLRGALD